MQINLYGYGKLCWNNQLTTQDCAQRWIGLTFDLAEDQTKKLADLLVKARLNSPLLADQDSLIGFAIRS